jgi:hypothetical protein
MEKEDDYEKLGDWSEQDVEEPDFEGKTEAGGWWSDDRPHEERRAHPRVPFNARVELIPPDGTVHECEAVNLSIGGVLLKKTNRGSLPELGQMVVIEVDDDIMLDGIVIRHENDAARFAAQFVNLDTRLRTYLTEKVGAELDGSSKTSYAVSKREPGDE